MAERNDNWLTLLGPRNPNALGFPWKIASALAFVPSASSEGTIICYCVHLHWGLFLYLGKDLRDHNSQAQKKLVGNFSEMQGHSRFGSSWTYVLVGCIIVKKRF
ncbi:hypothetical protein V6N13_136333 [Hibiscus sabdariffa]